MSNEELIARLSVAMEAFDVDTLGDDPVVFDDWRLLHDARAALEAQSAPPPQSVQDALDLLDSINGDAAIQYHAYASLHDAISRIEPQSAPLLADSREALAKFFYLDNAGGHESAVEHWDYLVDRIHSGKETGSDSWLCFQRADALIASGVVSLAADRDRAAKKAAWFEGFEAGWAECSDPGAFVNDVWDAKTPNPYRESEGN